MFKSLIRRLHWFLGITLGLVLTIMGVTGAITAFDDEIIAALDKGVIAVAPRAAPTLAPDALMARFAQQRPGAKPTLLTLRGEAGGSARVTFIPAETPKGSTAPPEKLYLDPYTGQVLGQARGEVFFAKVLLLHRIMLLPGGSDGPGRQLTGAAALALLFFVLSGLYLRWPKAAGDWKAWLTFKPRQRGRALYRGLHVTAGTWVMLVYLLSAVTGLSFSYDWWRDGLSLMLTGAVPAAKVAEAPAKPAKPGAGKKAKAPPAALDPVWRTVLGVNGGQFDSAIITLPKASAKTVRVRYLARHAPHNRAFNEVVVDARTGAVVKLTRFDNLPLGRKLMAAMVAVHRGAFFGLAGRIIVMTAAALMPGFFITGWLLYLDRRRRETEAARLAKGLKTGHPGADEILVAFASQTGTAEQLAWRTAASLIEGGRVARVVALQTLSAADLAGADILLVVASTYGEGEPPDAVGGFARKTMSRPLELSGLRYAVLALGDRTHADFCAFGRRLDGWLAAGGGQATFQRVEVDGAIDADALARWRDALSTLGAETADQTWGPAHHEPWRLVERRLLNPGGVGGEAWHVALTPPEASRLVWTAGDIAEIVPGGQGETGAVRDYSISSLPDSGRVELLVRKTVLPDGTLGLGSGWLTHHAPLGETVALRVRANANFHPPRVARPMILIGAGTGFAGLRAHLAHRTARGLAPAWLIFGERSGEADRYYADELEAWARDGVLARRDLVFSRDGGARRYVQDLIAAEGVELTRWIEDGAAIFVCGGIAMAAAVDQTLAALLGQDRLDELAAERRYQRDVY